MPPKGRSTTKSSKSSTSNSTRSANRAASSATGLDTPVQFVKGVGPRLGVVLSGRGIETVGQLLQFFPRTYEDRTRVAKISELTDGMSATLRVTILGSNRIPIRGGRSMLEARCTDDSKAVLGLKWFYAPKGMEENLKPGASLTVTGAVKFFRGRPEIVHPETSKKDAASNDSQDFGRIIPVYIEIEGVPTKTLRKVLWEAKEKYLPIVEEDLPEVFLNRHGLPLKKDAIRKLHFPEVHGSLAPEEQIKCLNRFETPEQKRLIYEEFFKFEYLVLRRRLRMEKELSTPIGKNGGAEALKELETMLPFKLTRDQMACLSDISKDLANENPMQRLIQGDVGSGKTAVAFLSAGAALAEGGQACLMVPTEILAEQHYKNAIKIFGGKLPVALLTGKSTAAERRLLIAELGAGKPLLVIGTHALIEEPIVFKNLVYVLIDEQHRFGVEQRRILRLKGARVDEKTGKRILPHNLILTATPIPRTLALTAYGDLTVSTIKERPPGRSPIITKVFKGTERVKAYELIRSELRKGRQAYCIFPLVEDSEAEGFEHLKSAVSEADRLQKEVFPEFKIGLLHGQLKSDEKSKIMESFSRGELHLLVSTTVIEVGVDVPNSTIILIEHAERFGLSQIHQLRGRVGRGKHQSYCLLISGRPGEISQARLDILEETEDGFKIAEADLEIRGPGEFLGTRQSGDLPFKIANLVRDQDWLLRAREDVLEILKIDPDLGTAPYQKLRQYFEREGILQAEILRTS